MRNNFERFPNNVLEPTPFVDVDGTEYTLFTIKFDGLYDLYNFLNSNPSINTKVFDANDLASINGNEAFAGRPYDEAVKLLIEDSDPGYNKYLRLQKQIKSKNAPIHKFVDARSVAGGVLNPVAYATSSPEPYTITRAVYQPKFITLDIQISYNNGVERAQIFNKAVIITNLVHALERRGYSVNVNSFEISYCGYEIVKSTFKIKSHGATINYQALYKTLVDPEFVRRICFRLNEIADVKNRGWAGSYGRAMEEDMVRRVLRIRKEDYYLGSPDEMGIYGASIGEDFENVVLKLGLNRIIDIEKERNVIEDCVKVLKR